MFYLLNSLYSKVWGKRIVCDKQLLDSYKERGIDYCGEPEIEIYQNPSKKLELHIIGKRKDDSKYIYANEGIVENQSENVFDLIEKGDLVNTIVDSIYQVVIIAKNTIIAPQMAFDLAVVTAIYKPNEKGDYIKVWEVKENGQ